MRVCIGAKGTACAAVLGIVVMAGGVARADATGRHDVIELKDGKTVEGQIVETKGGWVTIVLAGGIRTTVSWTQIKKIVQGVVDAPQPPAGSASTPPAAPAPAPAPAPTPAPTPAPASAPTTDVVTLKTGEKITGKVTRQVPGQFVQIQTTAGTNRVLNWDNVADVLVASTDAAPALSGQGPVVKTTTRAQVTSAGAQLEYAQDCQQLPDSPKCHKSATVTAGQAGVTAHLESQDASGTKSADLSARGAHAEMKRDCSDNPADERCTQQGSLDVGKGGLTASFKQETVTRVKEPPSGSVNFAADVGGGTVLGLPDGISMAFVQTTLKLQMLAGTQFPGPDGGSWNGILIEPSAAVMSVFLSAPDGSGSSSSTTVFGVQLGGTVGYQFMTYGKMNPDTLKQQGFGILLGGFAGATGVSTPTTPDGGGGDVTWNSSYGPALGLSFPSYNAGTANYSAFSITAMVLPTGSSTFVSGNLGWIF